jgi:aryl-alcohol dehydrogenase-like predicted oxidoreductase
MQTRSIGSLAVSVVGLGCNNFGGRLDETATKAVVDEALDVGITFFDTADIYGGTRSEEYLGRALGTRRESIVVATKFGIPYEGHAGGASPQAVRSAAEASLQRLGTEYIDLYQLHFPDEATPIAETLGAMGELVAEGKVREIGCSNVSAAQIRAATAVTSGAAGFVSVQNQYSLLHREPEAEVLPACERAGIAFLPYFPLANGLLTGKYQRHAPVPEGTRIGSMPPERQADVLDEPTMATVAGLAELAGSHDRTLLELAVSWLLTRPTVASVIAGATAPAQIRANAGAGGWELPADVLERIDELTAR